MIFFQKFDLPETVVSPITGLPKEIFTGGCTIKNALPLIAFALAWLGAGLLWESIRVLWVAFFFAALSTLQIVTYRWAYPQIVQKLHSAKPIKAILNHKLVDNEIQWEITTIDTVSSLTSSWRSISGGDGRAFWMPVEVEVYIYEMDGVEEIAIEGPTQVTLFFPTSPKRVEPVAELQK